MVIKYLGVVYIPIKLCSLFNSVTSKRKLSEFEVAKYKQKLS